jgi:beta-lactamase regulating signal transducer with metallopeptidase domain
MRELLLSAAAWWLGTALCGGLILLAACWVMRRVAQPALRQRLGELAVLAALVVAVLRLGPAWWSVSWPATPARAAPPAPHTALAALTPALPPLDGVWVETSQPAEPPCPKEFSLTIVDPEPPPPAAPEGPQWDWRPWVVVLTALYLFVVALLTVRWLLGQWALGRLLRQGRPASLRVRRLFTVMAAGVVWPLPRLRLSRRLRAPVCFGLRRPAVLLPEVLDFTADDTVLRWVFAHELTHLRRRDPWSYWALGLAQAVYFYLPWFWWLRRQVRLCQEYIADAAAAREGTAADEYAEFLVSLAKRPATPLGATGLGSSSDLMRRVQMLLQSTTRVQGSCPRRWSLVTAGGLFGAAVLLSGLGLRAEPPGDGAKKDEMKKEVILKKLGDEEFKVLINPVEVKNLPLFEVLLSLDDEEQTDKKADTKDKKDGDKDEKKGEAKKAPRMRIVVEVDGKTVTIPFDGDFDADKIKERVQKALAERKKQTEAAEKEREKAQAAREKAREQAQAARERAREIAQAAREKALAERKKAEEKGKAEKEPADEAMKKHLEAAEKALKGLEKELGDDQFKALMKKIEELKAGKGEAAEAARKAAEQYRRALEQGQFLRGRTFSFQHGTGRLGVQVEKPSTAMADQLDLPKDQGLVVVSVVKDSAAAKAGLKANDILLELDGKPVPSDTGAFARHVREIKADESIRAVVLRKGKKETIRGIKLPEAKDEGRTFQWQELPGAGAGFGVMPGAKFEFKVNPGDVIVPGGARGRFAPKAAGAGEGKGEGKSEKKANTSVSVEIKDGSFKAVQKEGDITITVTGKASDGKVNVSQVKIEEDGSSKTYTSVDKVPAKYRDRVKKLLSNAGDSPIRFEYRKSGQSDDGVRGTIRRVEGDLATISVGSDAGVATGHELQVFRTQPKPEHLGTVKVLNVTAHEAVGRLQGPKQVQVRAGDEIATTVIGTGNTVIPAGGRTVIRTETKTETKDD